MTTPNSNSPPGSVENVDTGPLSWVMVEIRESLNRSRTALQEALTQDAETQGTTLRHAKSFLHQAHGALQIVDVDGVAIITETVEDLFDRIEKGRTDCRRGGSGTTKSPEDGSRLRKNSRERQEVSGHDLNGH